MRCFRRKTQTSMVSAVLFTAVLSNMLALGFGDRIGKEHEDWFLGNFKGVQHMAHHMLEDLITDPGMCGTASAPGPLRNASARFTNEYGKPHDRTTSFCDPVNEFWVWQQGEVWKVPVKGIKSQRRRQGELIAKGPQIAYHDVGWMASQVKVSRAEDERPFPFLHQWSQHYYIDNKLIGRIEIPWQVLTHRCPSAVGPHPWMSESVSSKL